MGCPVPKIAKHSAGCSLMREPAHAAEVVRSMVRGVRIPVTVKMRAGWDADAINAPELARRLEDVGASALAVHGRTAAQSYSGFSDWELIGRVASGVSIPVFGSGDCVEAAQVVDRMLHGGVAGVLIGRGALRNPWIFEQAAALIEGRTPRVISAAERARFLLDYIDLLLTERLNESDGFRHVAPGQSGGQEAPARGHDRWVINKLRALNSWFTKGLDGGSSLRVAINAAQSIAELRQVIEDFFGRALARVPEVASDHRRCDAVDYRH
jgi:tRNA-dihydrouridine synthase B